MTQCRADTPDSADLREIIYSPDGSVVRRWDRLGRRTDGVLGPGLPTHFSYFRDATKSGHDLRPLYRRYLADIGLIRPAHPAPEVGLQQTDKLLYDTGLAGRTIANVLADLQNLRNWEWSALGAPGVVNPPMSGSPAQLVLAMAELFPRVAAQVARLAGEDPADEPALAASLLAGLSPAAIAAAIPAALAEQVADELAARLAAANPSPKPIRQRAPTTSPPAASP